MVMPFAVHAPLIGEILVAKCKLTPDAIERGLASSARKVACSATPSCG